MEDHAGRGERLRWNCRRASAKRERPRLSKLLAARKQVLPIHRRSSPRAGSVLCPRARCPSFACGSPAAARLPSLARSAASSQEWVCPPLSTGIGMRAFTTISAPVPWTTRVIWPGSSSIADAHRPQAGAKQLREMRVRSEAALDDIAGVPGRQVWARSSGDAACPSDSSTRPVASS